MITTIERDMSGLDPATFVRQPEPRRLDRGVGLSMALQIDSSRRPDAKRPAVRVGGEALGWLREEVALDSVDVPASDTVCRLASMAETNGVLAQLNSEVGEQLGEGRAVVALEIVNWVNSEFEPDQTIRNSDPTIPPIYRVNHAMREGNISLFIIKERGQIEGSTFFWTASRRERAERLLAELANHGYTEVIDSPVSEDTEKTEEVVLLAA